MLNLNFAPKTDNDQSVPSMNRLDIIRSMITITAHFLIGVVVGVSLIFACKKDITISTTSQHIVLCVIGYQFLMGEAILSLAPNSWLSSLSLQQRRRVHWVMQVLGSILALTGGIIKSVHKTSKGVNYDTLHGQFGLASMIFTSLSLINGLTSLYAFELRHILRGSFSKLTHVCIGVVAYGTAATCLVYGFDKASFRTWASSHMADTVIIITGVLTVIVIINPLLSFYHKVSRAVNI